MKTAKIILPNQLFYNHDFFDDNSQYFLVEESLFFNQFPFHKMKLAFHRTTMKRFEKHLLKCGKSVTYIEAQSDHSAIENLVTSLSEKFELISFFKPVDNWIEKRIKQNIKTKFEEWENPLFMNTEEQNKKFFRADKHKFLHGNFYKQQRKTHQILIDKLENPIGGKWSFDEDNRKKIPAGLTIPKTHFNESDEFWDEAFDYVSKYFLNNLGELNKSCLLPNTPEKSEEWLNEFLKTKFELFGPYEDAIIKSDSFLFHSVLSPLINIGLISPNQVITSTLLHFERNNTPLNSTEGFVRQIIGWREFVRGIYESKGVKERTLNYWQFHRPIPKSFYDGTTGIDPIDDTIKKVLKTGFNHHIERLMILGNFMLLCEFSPDSVYQWFMEMYLDAYDWVMVPNVYGMSQFADGGIFATKPYISGSNYILKMSDYKKGDWCETWDALYWRFISKQEWFFSKNPRLKLMVNAWHKKQPSDQQRLLKTAEDFLNKLNENK